MIRAVLVIVLFVVLYQALKSVFHSASSAYHRGEDGRREKLPGDDMVLDPNCRTYVVKDRAIARRIRGTTAYFCSAACAGEYERKNRQ